MAQHQQLLTKLTDLYPVGFDGQYDDGLVIFSISDENGLFYFGLSSVNESLSVVRTDCFRDLSSFNPERVGRICTHSS